MPLEGCIRDAEEGGGPYQKSEKDDNWVSVFDAPDLCKYNRAFVATL